MKVIPPLTITNSILTSSSVAEPAAGETAWNSATNYTVGTQVIRTTTHKIYQNLIAGIDAGLPESTPARWVEVGTTNKWAMFDLLRNTQTSLAATSLTVVLNPVVRVNSLAVLGVVADSVTITMVASSVTVYTTTVNLVARNTTTYTDYFFGTFGKNPSLVLIDLPPYSSSTITITFNKASGTILCGACVVGNYVDLGDTQVNAQSDSLNFSTIARDTFGGAILNPKRSIPKTNQTTFINKTSVNKIRDVRELLNAVPAVWTGVDDSTDGYFEALLILGIYKRFTIDLTYNEYAIVTLELEEI